MAFIIVRQKVEDFQKPASCQTGRLPARRGFRCLSCGDGLVNDLRRAVACAWRSQKVFDLPQIFLNDCDPDFVRNHFP